ncbi:hypothetical protein WD309_004159, partial [Pseudomonas aeruginosa]
RRVIGWAFSAKPDAELVIKALDMAYEQRGKPQQVLFHYHLRWPKKNSTHCPGWVDHYTPTADRRPPTADRRPPTSSSGPT